MGSGLNFLQRSFVSALRMLTKVSAGYDMRPIQEEMVRTLGVGGTLRMIKMGAEITSTLSRAVGDYTAQTLISVAAMWNGCRYCVIGHNYSANLFRFRDTGVLGPLDEEELVELMRGTDDEVIEVLRQKFETSEPRTWQLLKATLAYWEWLNECTIILGVDARPGDVPALGFMRPPAVLVRGYDDARQAARAVSSRGERS